MTSSAADTPTTTRAKEIPKWTLKADYVETCNCDYGCSCNFTGFPSNGSCSALVGFHIRQGNYGVVKLDDLDVVDLAKSYSRRKWHSSNIHNKQGYSTRTERCNH